MFIPDALSRCGLDESKKCRKPCKILEIKAVNAARCQASLCDKTLDKIREHTTSDHVLQDVIKFVLNGWPDSKHQLPNAVKPFHHVQHDLTICDDLLFRENQIVIPAALRPEMLKKLHDSHQGIVKTKQRARTTIYWPGLNSQIEDMVSKCSICQEFRESQPADPLMSHDIPNMPWSKIAADLFHLRGDDYLILVDYYSKFPEVVKLSDTSSNTVIKEMKAMFARYGIPNKVISDNGPQFACSQFRDFAAKWNFEHVTTSPTFPQSNGQIERTVKTVKRMFKKAIKSGNSIDPYLMLLEYRNTPIDGMLGKSPAQLLNSRQLKSNLPATPEMLKPQPVPNMSECIKKRQAEQKFQHDRKLSPKTGNCEPKVGQAVRFKDPKGDWQYGRVTRKHHTPRSLIVENRSGKEYRRNKRHMFKTKEKPPSKPITDFGESGVSCGRVSKGKKLLDM